MDIKYFCTFLYNNFINVLEFAGFINRNLLDVLAPIQHSDKSGSPGNERFRD
jgi:hypothetical protein